MFCFLSFFLAFGCCIIFAFGMREKTGAWAPDIVAGEEGEQEVTNAAFRPRWREQLWGQEGGERIFLAKKLHFFLHFLQNP
jgi:hypothetical protein